MRARWPVTTATSRRVSGGNVALPGVTMKVTGAPGIALPAATGDLDGQRLDERRPTPICWPSPPVAVTATGGARSDLHQPSRQHATRPAATRRRVPNLDR